MNIEELKITNEDINLLKEMKENCLKASVYKDEKRLLKANAITKFLVEHQEKQELINYLKQEDIDLKENIINYEAKLRNTPRDSFYYNSYLKTLHRFRAKRELIKEILSKIEKSDK